MGYRILVLFFLVLSTMPSCHSGFSDEAPATRPGVNLNSILRHQKNSFTAIAGTRNTEDPSALKNSNWYAEAMNNIANAEYNISYQDQYGSYSSPNRQQNLRALYRNDRFSLLPRNDSADKWKLDLQLEGIYAGNQALYTPDANPQITQSANNIRFSNRDEFITEYINSREGVRQNFIISKKPSGDPESIQVRLNAGAGWYVDRVNKNELHFAKARRNGFANKLTYNDLNVWDADHKKLEAEFLVSGNEIAIQVMTKDARYPVTIDPISTTAAAMVQSDQALAYMGFSVSSAGDVNGDGYSDVIVGAYLYDAGQTDEGRAYVYHGSATGISTTAASILESNQANANFGIAVSTAGNVNGDAYSDVIVGASTLDSGELDEGGACVYYGSSTGIIAAGTPGNANSFIQTNQPNSAMGISVATAGDVNGDGYSDVIVGAYYYDNGNTDEGAAFIYHGSATGIVVAANPGNANRILDCNQDFGYMGVSVASAGDVNGDGFSDVVVGAYGYETGILFDNGAAFVYNGSAAGVSAVASASVYGSQDFGLMGNSVSSAGDVNGDGYSDVIVGANNFDNGQMDEGVAYIYHGSAGGMNTVAAVMLESNQTGAYFANSVACAGDVNGDGYSDVIVGCQYYSNGPLLNGEGAFFVYQGSATGISTTYTTMVESNQASALMGSSVACAGDVNGDGFSDVIVGAYNYDSGQIDEGAAFVYHGAAAGLRTTASSTMESSQISAASGFSVASAGDVNADGYGDVIVGARTYDNGETDEGVAFVYHGSASGINTTPAVILEVNQASALFGNAVACAGDVNGDGYSDVIVGAPQYANGESLEGNAFVFHGSASGINSVFSARLEANQATAFMGYSVAGAGDVNGDGYSDVIIGGWAYDNGEIDEGAAFVYHGTATGINTTAVSFLQSNQASCSFGTSVASAGDVNGDGYSDVIVGAQNYDSGETDEGAAFIFHGSVAGIIASGNPGNANALLQSNQATANFGFSVAGAGDINGDGYSDVIVGAYFYDNGESNEGAAFIYHGSAGGLNTTAAAMMESNQVNGYLGHSVASAGDVNGDGYSDVIVGAQLYTNGQASEGAAFVYHGSSTGINTTAAATMETNQASATVNKVASAGDVNGDGYSDVIVGSPGYDNPELNEGAAFVYLGNNGAGLRSNIRLYNTDLVTPIQRSNYLVNGLFGAGLFAKSPIGRMKGRLAWEVKANGQPFSGNPIGNTTVYYDKQVTWTNLGIAGVELKNQVQKRGRQTKIRTRVEYDKATAITGQVYGPWRYPPGYTMGAYGMNSVPLPLMLIAFNGQFANEDDVQLKWITENEINVRSFIVERSVDGINFITIGQLSAKGISGSRSDYGLVDLNVKENQLYYRLKIIEQNGAVSYSNIITLSRNKISRGSIAPNPVQRDGAVMLTYSSLTNASVQIRIVNASGLAVMVQKANLHIGENRIPVSLKGLAAGIYILQVTGDGVGESYRIVVE